MDLTRVVNIILWYFYIFELQYLEMNYKKYQNFLILTLFFCCILACQKEDDPSNASVTSFNESGLLGGTIQIKGSNFEVGMIQVFFDLEQAQVSIVSNTMLEVTVPRTLERFNPVLKVIDLRTNTTVLENNFLLKMPKIISYSNNNVTFGESFTINGENFDVDKSFVKVTVNNIPATLLESQYDHLVINIPTDIDNHELEIKVTAQLQEIISGIPLSLKNPVINEVVQDEIYIGGTLEVSGANFNPDYKKGKVFINDIPTYFTSKNDKLFIEVPAGPYSDFKFNNIRYETAGLSVSFNCDVVIKDNSIMVDANDFGPNLIFIHNNAAYSFMLTATEPVNHYVLKKFESTDEKWRQVSNFEFEGYLNDVVYDEEDTAYLSLRDESGNPMRLVAFNMNSFTETTLPLPSSSEIIYPILFTLQQNLYFVSGLYYNNGNPYVSHDKFKFSKTTGQWETLPESIFSELPLVSIYGGGAATSFFDDGKRYINYGNYDKTFVINPDLSVTILNRQIFFIYQNAILGGRYTYTDTLYNMITQQGMNIVYGNFRYWVYNFFVLNNEVYFHGSRNNVINTTTNRLKKEILNEIL